MLDNARKYVEELRNKLIDAWYDERYKYYFVGNWHKEYSPPQDDWEEMCFVSLDKDGNILGLISYRLDRNISSAYDFGAINLSDNKSVFGMDLYRVIDNIFCKFNMQRIEFNVVCGNPIEKSYDKMVTKCGGRIIGTRRRAAKLLDNQVYDDKLYEILKEDYLKSKRQAEPKLLKAYRIKKSSTVSGVTLTARSIQCSGIFRKESVRICLWRTATSTEPTACNGLAPQTLPRNSRRGLARSM